MKDLKHWSLDERIEAIRSIVDFIFENESGGLETPAFKAIRYICYEDEGDVSDLLEPFDTVENDKGKSIRFTLGRETRRGEC